ncbi:MAG TPA: hypothetical protein VMH22_00710 [bacterium]|nr:hypothetical protein [bacterium]
MTPSKKSNAGASRPRQTPGKRSGTGMTQVIMIVAGIVVLIIMAVLLFQSAGKKPVAAPTGAVVDTALGVGGTHAARKPPARTLAASHAKRDTTKRRLEQQSRLGTTAAGGGARTTRTATGGYVHTTDTHVASSTNQLTAILTDATGSRVALIGDQRLKAGDDVAGHRILDVEGDAVKVQFRDNTYTVKIGEKVY